MNFHLYINIYIIYLNFLYIRFPIKKLCVYNNVLNITQYIFKNPEFIINKYMNIKLIKRDIT